MIQGESILLSYVFPSSLPHFPRKLVEVFRLTPVGRFAAHEADKEGKAKTPPALQGKFPPALPSSFASAFSAHPFKGRFAFRSAALHYTLDLLARLRLPLLTTAAPREISSQGRRLKKTKNAVRIFSPCPSSLSPSWPDAFPVSTARFPRPRMMLSGSDAFVFPQRSFCLFRVYLFVLRHPGRPAYVSYTHATAWYPIRLARGYAPLTPTRPAKGSGQGKSKRRKRQ